MTPNYFTRAALCLALLPFAVPVAAQTAPPNSINFQGRLATSSGNPVADGTYNLRLRLYDAATGGTTLYDQTLNNIPVKNGTFAVQLSGFTADKFNGNAWLGISINGAADLTPRTQIVSVPYALKSNLAMTVPDASITNAKLSGGITADKLASGALNTTAWLLGGNNISNPATQFFGTTGNQPLVFRTNNTERMRILANGNVGIGTATPTFPLHNTGGYYGFGDIRLYSYDGDGEDGTAFVQARDNSSTSNIGLTLRTKSGSDLYDAIKMAPLGRVAIATDFYNSSRLSVEGNGYEYAVGTYGKMIASQFVTSSDARLKEHIETVPDALSLVLGLRGVTYDWKPDAAPAAGKSGKQYGFLAQEVEQLLPALVQPGLNGYKAVNYQGVIPVLVEAVKAQQAQIAALKSEQKTVNALAVRMEAMEAENRQLKTLLLEMAQRQFQQGTAVRR